MAMHDTVPLPSATTACFSLVRTASPTMPELNENIRSMWQVLTHHTQNTISVWWELTVVNSHATNDANHDHSFHVHIQFQSKNFIRKGLPKNLPDGWKFLSKILYILNCVYFHCKICKLHNFIQLCINYNTRWTSGTVPDLQSRGRGLKSRVRLLCTNANSACHPSGVG